MLLNSNKNDELNGLSEDDKLSDSFKIIANKVASDIAEQVAIKNATGLNQSLQEPFISNKDVANVMGQ